jgi:hypothetical protein
VKRGEISKEKEKSPGKGRMKRESRNHLTHLGGRGQRGKTKRREGKRSVRDKFRNEL